MESNTSNPLEEKPLESEGSNKTLEANLSEQEILDLIAETSHKTWRRQAHRDKGTPMNELPEEVSGGDRERATDAWKALKETIPKTRHEAVDLLSERSHQMWLAYKERERQKVDGPKEVLDPNPNSHDRERAEDIVKALETRGLLLLKG